METINRIELRGLVGSVRKTEISGIKHADFSLRTDRVVKRGNEPYVETEWHSCEAWQDRWNNLDLIEKGKALHVFGRLRYQSYVTADGVDKIIPSILVTKIEED